MSPLKKYDVNIMLIGMNDSIFVSIEQKERARRYPFAPIFTSFQPGSPSREIEDGGKLTSAKK